MEPPDAVVDPDVELWLVRHGETEWSRNGRHTSTTELPLTSDGERVAAALREQLQDVAFDLVLTSPRERARRTAALAGFPDAEVDPDLAEWDYGDYEGVTTAEIREQQPGWTIWDGTCPGGETAAQVGERLDRVVRRVQDTLRDSGGRCLVFGHGHSGRVLTARWLDLAVREGRHFKLDTATVSALGYEREAPVVTRWNA